MPPITTCRWGREHPSSPAPSPTQAGRRGKGAVFVVKGDLFRSSCQECDYRQRLKLLSPPVWTRDDRDVNKVTGSVPYQRIHQPRNFKHMMHNLASELRQRATLSESLLWEAIRNRQIEGYKFRRQVPIGGFVVDFYCAEQKLAIEVDGSSHRDREQEDRLRQQAIEALGIRFLRFSAEQVETDLQSVLMEIRSELG